MNDLNKDLTHIKQNSGVGITMDGRDAHGYQKFSYVRSASIGGFQLILLFSHLDRLEKLGTPQGRGLLRHRTCTGIPGNGLRDNAKSRSDLLIMHLDHGDADVTYQADIKEKNYAF